MRRRFILVPAVVSAAVVVAAGAASGARRVDAAASSCPRVVVAAGDMNKLSATRATGNLAVAQDPDVVATLGDQQYPDGSLADYRRQYDRTGWGRLKSKTKPVPGNHEYRTPGARGYFAYFNDPPRYYAYSLGCGWRGYALNSEIDISTQARWLRHDLAAHPGEYVLAYWHAPRYSSSTHGKMSYRTEPFFDALDGRRGVVLAGHAHNYERFALRGQLRPFVVGTGGSSTYAFKAPLPNSQTRIAGTPGILVLRLESGGRYSWRFLAASGRTADSGTS